jgi:methylthioribose-1-phosphate isomerase
VKIGGESYRSIWLDDDGWAVRIIDQTLLPHALDAPRLEDLEGAAGAIATMQVRGAPLIGVTAAYGLALALREAASDVALEAARGVLLMTRPTAVNLRWALDRVGEAVASLPPEERAAAAYREAAAMADEDVAQNRALGEHGLAVIRELADRRAGEPVRILTHCNAGWLATVDWGTATSPIYQAHEAGIPVHVWVDETRPRNQGASLTAWELGHHGVPHTVIVDNAGGHLMQRGEVDMVLVGTDRTTARGDVANKIGTYLKALAAHDTGVPFYVAAPSPSIDWTLDAGTDIPIEERPPEEVAAVKGRTSTGRIETVSIVPEGSPVANPAFDVTPARYVTGIITERGVARASRDGLAELFPEKATEPAAGTPPGPTDSNSTSGAERGDGE